MGELFGGIAIELASLLRELSIGPQPPDAAGVEALLETGFWASLDREEGRSIRASLAFARRDEAYASAIHALAEPVQLSRRNVTKLAPAIDPFQGFLAIDAGREPGAFEIWGLHFGRRPVAPFDGAGTSGHAVFTALAPGVLELTSGSLPVWLFERGVVQTDRHATLAQVMIARALDAPFDSWRAWMLTWLARRIIEAGHGGMLVVIDVEEPIHMQIEKQLETPSTLLRDSWPVFEPTTTVRVEGQSEPAYTSASSPQALAGLNDVLDSVSLLANVDGAVVLRRDDLAVVGFAARLEGNDPPRVLERGTDGQPTFVTVGSLGGTRHQSAARWCSAYGSGGFAIVVSQDGVSSLVKRVGSDVVFLRPLYVTHHDTGVLGVDHGPAGTENPADFFTLFPAQKDS